LQLCKKTRGKLKSWIKEKEKGVMVSAGSPYSPSTRVFSTFIFNYFFCKIIFVFKIILNHSVNSYLLVFLFTAPLSYPPSKPFMKKLHPGFTLGVTSFFNRHSFVLRAVHSTIQCPTLLHLDYPPTLASLLRHHEVSLPVLKH